MKSCLGLLILVLISGCFSSPDHTQYIVTEEGETLRPFAMIQYNISKDGITAKITLYQKQYLNPSSIPGYMDCEYKELPTEFEKVNHCTVFDTNNFEGDLSFFNIKMVNGKWVAPTIGVRCIGFIKWKTDVTVSCRDWVEGTKHPTKHLVAAYKKDHWLPEEGYEWVKDDKNKVKSDADGYGIVKKTRDTFYKELTKKVPDWQKTCEDPYFVSWLNQIDPNTKRLRSQLFKEAIDTSDVNKVELFFTEYLQSRTASLTRSPSTIITPSYPKFAETEKASPAPPARDSIEATSQIQTLKEIVKKDPKNLPAWVELGNLYFDTDQPKEAIEAYSRYLAVKPDNPDVRTDKGIMYRKLGEFDKAIEEFREAALSDPKHINSRYNIGLVFLHDKKDVQGAIKAWEEYLKVDPNSERAQRIKAQIEKMKTMPAPEK